MAWESVFDEIFGAIETALGVVLDNPYGAVVMNTEPPLEERIFPLIVCKQTNYYLKDETLSHTDKQHRITVEAQIYAINQESVHKRVIANSLADLVVPIIQDTYGLKLEFGQSVPNFADENVYRIVLRFSGVLRDSTEVIYRE